jgi:hypothetical protein
MGKFIKALVETRNVGAAARAAGRSVATCYRWRERFEPFAVEWAASLAIGYDRLETALLDYALEKVERPLVEAGAETDADGGDEIDGVAAVALARSISQVDLNFAVGILARHRGVVDAPKVAAKQAKAPTEAEVDAALTRALDGLARRANAT